MRFVAALCLVIGWSAASVADALPRVAPEEVGMSSERLKRMDRAMQEYVDDDRLAGIVTLIARRGKIAHLGTYGMADLEAEREMSADTIFRIASMSKAITSTAAMMLYEEGRLRLDDPVTKFLSEFAETKVIQTVEGSDEAHALVEPKRQMTIRHLLTHTSGLTYGEGLTRQYYSGKRLDGGFGHSDFTLADMVEDIAQAPLAFHPGDEWHYGYSIDVLGRVVEVASGMTLAEFFEQRIFQPLGMTDTAFYMPDKEGRFAAVYSPDEENGGLTRHEDAPEVWRTVNYPYAGPQKMYAGGGGLSATITDYARFCQMILNGGELGGARLLSPTTVRVMGRDNLSGDVEFGGGNRFGLGFMVHTDPVVSRSVRSKGTLSWGGFWHTDYFIDPELELIGIIMTQIQPATGLDDHAMFETLTYQAIVE